MNAKPDWQPITENQKHGFPLWVRGHDWGNADNAMHYGWAFWDGANWIWAQSLGIASHVTEYLKNQKENGL